MIIHSISQTKQRNTNKARASSNMSNKTMIREDNNNEAMNNVVVVNKSSSLEFVSFLGKGAFGSVSLMRDSKHQLYAEKSSPLDLLKSLEKEHRIMLRFRNHPRIVQTTSPNIGFNLDRCYINMEFASKGTLHNVISQLRGMPEFMIGRAALMILQGLEALHSRGYVHCDLKPANVLLFPSKTFGEPWDLKLADFGLSKEPGMDSRSSLSGGTPQYMPPESLGRNGAKMVGPAVDMWSLGCVVVEMFGGWPEKKRGCYAWRLPILVSPVANDFLRRCMALEPSRRSTAADLLKHPFVVAPLRGPMMMMKMAPLRPDQMLQYCPHPVRRQIGPMMMRMVMAPPRHGDLIC